jgi:hypothetical protein
MSAPHARSPSRLTRSRHRGPALVGATLAVLAAGLSACAKNPTELVMTVTIDATPSKPITSLAVTLDASGNRTGRNFAALGPIPADAHVAPFTFPTIIDFLIANDADSIVGNVAITIEGSDPLSSDTVLARGVGAAVVNHAARATAEVAMMVIAPSMPGDPDAGTPDGAPADTEVSADAADAAADGP